MFEGFTAEFAESAVKRKLILSVLCVLCGKKG
jgi:hypothetical protein